MDFDFGAWLHHVNTWQSAAFGDGPRVEGLLDHLTKEIEEIRAKPDDVEEWVDLIFLAVDGARRHVEGYSKELFMQALANKLDVNLARTWPDPATADPTKAIEHVRSEA